MRNSSANDGRASRIYTLTLILLLGAALRLHALGQDARLHPDEALYATFARSAVVYGEWMLPGLLDKPPLSIYAAAVSIHFLGRHHIVGNVYGVDLRRGEFAVRVPNTLASILLVAVVYRLARGIYRKRDGHHAGLLAAFLAATSPYLLVFSAAAFTDMLMVFFGMMALLMAVYGRDRHAGWSGVFLALSFWTKPQGIFFLPLVVAVLALCGRERQLRRAVIFATLFVAGVVLLLVWDHARPGTSVFVLADSHYTVEHGIAPVGEWLPRLRAWLAYAGWLLGPPLVTWGVLGLCAVGVWHTGASRIRAWYTMPLPVVWGYCAAYFVAHWLAGLHMYDRYLLPLAPLLAVGVSGGIIPGVRMTAWRWAMTAAMTTALLLTAWQAASWQIDLGRDHYPVDRDGEILQLAAYLQAQPVATIIYDPWLGWEMGYYLGVWSDKRHVHYPDAESLVRDALNVPETGPRYFIAPAHANTAPWIAGLEQAGFTVSVAFETPAFRCYRLSPPLSVIPSGGTGA